MTTPRALEDQAVDLAWAMPARAVAARPGPDEAARLRQRAAALRLATRTREGHWQIPKMLPNRRAADCRAALSAWDRADDHDVPTQRG
jgi:hypothetical protein